jgi:hypothetical protein
MKYPVFIVMGEVGLAMAKMRKKSFLYFLSWKKLIFFV